jgi:hypothetical protein
MTKAYVTEYVDVMQQQGGMVPIGVEPALATQVVDYTAAHAESTALNTRTRFVRVHVDSISSNKFSLAGTAATTSDKRMAAGATEYFGVGDNHAAGLIISFITNT